MLKFLKMHGLGNDFVILDQRDNKNAPVHEQIQHICDRHKGVGCDQLILIEPTKGKADAFMRIYNPDASEAESCGNATRCVADILMKEKKSKKCVVETLGGVLNCRAVDDLVEVDMGAPKLEWQDIPLAEEKDTLHLGIGEGPAQDPVAVNIGNPHCVFFVDDVEAIDIAKIGPVFENHQLYPKKTNVEFAQIQSKKAIRLRVWERGAGVTLACGSAACATIVAAASRELTGRKVAIEMDGGTLSLEWRKDDDHILMTGPVSYVFDGVMKDIA